MCPPGAAEGQADLLPLESSSEWVFDYTRDAYQNTSGSPRSSETGTLSLTLGEATCASGVRTVSAVERRSGERIDTRTRADGVVTETTSAVETERDVVLTETASGVLLPWATSEVQRYHDAARDGVTVGAGYYAECSTHQAVVTLTQAGVSAFEGGCNRSSQGVQFTLRRLSGG